MYWEERRRYEEEVEYFEWYRRYGRDPRGLPPPPPRPFGPGVPPLMVSYICMSQVFYACSKYLYHFKSSAEFIVVQGFIQKFQDSTIKRSLLTLDVKFLHHLQSTHLLHEYSSPSISAMLGSIPGSPFLELCQVPAAIPLESLQWC